MNLHYYGHTSEQVSNYAYETFECEGITFMLQCSALFGVKNVNNYINNPVVIIERDFLFHRFVAEDFHIKTDEKGQLMISDEQFREIAHSIKEVFV